MLTWRLPYVRGVVVALEVILDLGVRVARQKGYPPSHPFLSDQNDDGRTQIRVAAERDQACSRAAMGAPAGASRKHSKPRRARAVVVAAAAVAAVSAPVPAGTTAPAASTTDDAG